MFVIIECSLYSSSLQPSFTVVYYLYQYYDRLRNVKVLILSCCIEKARVKYLTSNKVVFNRDAQKSSKGPPNSELEVDLIVNRSQGCYQFVLKPSKCAVNQKRLRNTALISLELSKKVLNDEPNFSILIYTQRRSMRT